MNKPKEKPLTQKDLVDLTLGNREPQNNKERLLLQQIKEIESRGNIIDVVKEFN